MRALRLGVVVALGSCTGEAAPARPQAVAEVSGDVASIAVTPVPAAAPPPAADGIDRPALDALLRRCHGEAEGHPLGTIVDGERLGAPGRGLFLVRTTGSGERRLLLTEKARGGCPAFVLGPGVASVRGDFLGDGGERTAVLLSQGSDDVSCDNDACPVALLVRDEAGAVRTAIAPGLDCETYELATVRLFADRASIELRCGGGTVDTERQIGLFHVLAGELVPLIVFDAGITTVALTEDEKRVCTSRSRDGGYTVKARGAAPVLEVFAVSGLREASRSTWTFSAAEQRMIEGTPRPVELSTPRASCKPSD